MMNDRYVSLAPARSYSAFFASRICATREKFTSNTECTCADVRRLSTMCSAIRLRIDGHRLRLTPGNPAARQAVKERGGRRGRAAAGRARLRSGPDCPADEREDVVLRHATGDAGAVNLRDVDVVFLGDLPDERRRSLTDSAFDPFRRRRFRLEVATGLSRRGLARARPTSGAGGAGAGRRLSGGRRSAVSSDFLDCFSSA